MLVAFSVGPSNFCPLQFLKELLFVFLVGWSNFCPLQFLKELFGVFSVGPSNFCPLLAAGMCGLYSTLGVLFLWKFSKNRLNIKKNQMFLIFIFSSSGHFCSKNCCLFYFQSGPPTSARCWPRACVTCTRRVLFLWYFSKELFVVFVLFLFTPFIKFNFYLGTKRFFVLFSVGPSNFCPLLAAGMCGLYSTLPRVISPPCLHAHTLTVMRGRVGDVPNLPLFVENLRFCDDVIQVISCIS